MSTDPINPYAAPRSATAPAADEPAPDRQYTYRSLRPAAEAITVAVAILALLEIVTLAELVEGGVELRIVYGLVSIVAGIAFCFLMVRANRNTRAFGAGPLKFTPGWSAGCFFVPVFCWFWPYHAMADVWRASDVEHETPWQYIPLPLLLPLWWGGWLVTSIGGRVVSFFTDNVRTAADRAIALRVDQLHTLVSIAACFLCIAVVRQLAARHAGKDEQLRSRPLSAAVG